MIYFLQPTDGGPVKIGTTENFDVRLKQLTAHYRRPLAVLTTMPGGRKEEAEIHARFSHLRMGRTEQFRPAPELMEFIEWPLLVSANPNAVEVMGCERPTILALKGTQSQADWLEAVHRKTRLPKSTIVRMALEEWALANAHPPFPWAEDNTDA